jgi:energy-converting hydrogenase Eha subunit H
MTRMSPRHPVRAIALLTTTLLLALSGAAYAQPDIPPNHHDLLNGKPWTYVFGKMILAASLALVAGIVLLYLVKARDFRANQKRGGSK